MYTLRNFKVILVLLLITIFSQANDGGYTMSGNQLVPIEVSDISIKKEVLSIKRVESNHNEYLDVKVEYTFYNPNKAKKILVGFEAFEPYGDVDSEPVNGGHPYMKDFLVLVNGKQLPYKIASGDSSIMPKDETSNVGYVYYFDVLFKKGLNSITHTYRYESSGSVGTYYSIDYILSAASRWKGKVIEDFTLIIDVGEYESFFISKTFFSNVSEWQFNGVAVDSIGDNEEKALRFYLKKSPLVFKKKNFKIRGELYLVSLWTYSNQSTTLDRFDYKKDKLGFAKQIIFNELPIDKTSYKIYKNLSYAREGYVFKDPVVLKYYEQFEWYRKNPNYKPLLVHQRGRELEEKMLKILKNLLYAKQGYKFKDYYLNSFFESQKWYVANKSYRANFSALSKNEQAWISKIKAMKSSDEVDFYDLLDEYKRVIDEK